MGRFLSATAVFTYFLLNNLSYASEPTSMGSLVVTGAAQVASTPDTVVVRLGVNAEAESAEDALAEMQSEAATLLAYFDEAAIEDKDRQTSSISLTERRARYDGPRNGQIIGYAASTTISLRLDGIERASKIMDGALDNGANQLFGLEFDLQNPKPIQDKALQSAVTDALNKARLMAKAANVQLGPIIRLQEGIENYAPRAAFAMERMGAAADTMPISAGEITTTANVTVTFSISSP